MSCISKRSEVKNLLEKRSLAAAVNSNRKLTKRDFNQNYQNNSTVSQKQIEKDHDLGHAIIFYIETFIYCYFRLEFVQKKKKWWRKDNVT